MALAALALGCFIDADEPSGTGDLSLRWTVDKTADPEACFFYATDSVAGVDLELVVRDDAGRTVVTEQVPCEEFRTTLTLRSGWYEGEVTMVDPSTAAALSTTLPLNDIRIYSDEELQLDVDFPASSFLR